MARTPCREGKTIKERYMAQRGRSVIPLAELGMPEKAYEPVEKRQDYRALVKLCSGEISELELVDTQNRVYEAVKVIGKTSIDTEDAVKISSEKYAVCTLTSKERASCR